jgi:hypothetical protein
MSRSRRDDYLMCLFGGARLSSFTWQNNLKIEILSTATNLGIPRTPATSSNTFSTTYIHIRRILLTRLLEFTYNRYEVELRYVSFVSSWLSIVSAASDGISRLASLRETVSPSVNPCITGDVRHLFIFCHRSARSGYYRKAVMKTLNLERNR